MRNSIAIICVLTCVLSANGQQDTLQSGMNMLKLDIAQLTFSGTIHMQYERLFFNRSSVQAEAGYVFAKNTLGSEYERTGVKLNLQYRARLSVYEDAFELRYYGGVYAGYRFLQFTREEQTQEYDPNTGNYYDVAYESLDQFTSISTGFLIGVELLYAPLVIDMYVGAGPNINGKAIDFESYNYGNDYRGETGTFGQLINPGYAGMLPKVGLQMGVMF